MQLLDTPVGQALMMDPTTGELDKSALSRILQVGGLENLVQSTNLDRAEGERVFNDLVTGRALPQMMPWQNLAVHAEVFAEHMKTSTFRSYDPGLQDVVLQYYILLQQAIGAQAEDALLAQIDQEAEATEDVTYAEEHAKHQAEVDVKGKPVMNTGKK